MARGQAKQHWWWWSHWMAVYLNTKIDPKKTAAFEPRDLNPFMESDRDPLQDLESERELARAKARTHTQPPTP